MRSDTTTETIAHFIGSFALPELDPRLRIDHEEFNQRAEQASTARPLEQIDVDIKARHDLEGYDPTLKLKLSQTAESGATPAGETMRLPVAEQSAGFVGATPFVAASGMTEGSGPIVISIAPQILVALPNSIAQISVQTLALSDNDSLMVTDADLFTDPAMRMEELLSLAKIGVGVTTFEIPSLTVAAGGWHDFASQVADAIAAVSGLAGLLQAQDPASVTSIFPGGEAADGGAFVPGVSWATSLSWAPGGASGSAGSTGSGEAGSADPGLTARITVSDTASELAAKAGGSSFADFVRSGDRSQDASEETATGGGKGGTETGGTKTGGTETGGTETGGTETTAMTTGDAIVVSRTTTETGAQVNGDTLSGTQGLAQGGTAETAGTGGTEGAVAHPVQSGPAHLPQATATTSQDAVAGSQAGPQSMSALPVGSSGVGPNGGIPEAAVGLSEATSVLPGVPGAMPGAPAGGLAITRAVEAEIAAEFAAGQASAGAASPTANAAAGSGSASGTSGAETTAALQSAWMSGGPLPTTPEGAASTSDGAGPTEGATEGATAGAGAMPGTTGASAWVSPGAVAGAGTQNGVFGAGSQAPGVAGAAPAGGDAGAAWLVDQSEDTASDRPTGQADGGASARAGGQGSSAGASAAAGGTYSGTSAVGTAAAAIAVIPADATARGDGSSGPGTGTGPDAASVAAPSPGGATSVPGPVSGATTAAAPSPGRHVESASGGAGGDRAGPGDANGAATASQTEATDGAATASGQSANSTAQATPGEADDAEAPAAAPLQEPAPGPVAQIDESVLRPEVGDGPFVNGAPAEELTYWRDEMPTFLSNEDDARETPEAITELIGDNPWRVDDGHKVVTGANQAANEAHIVKNWVDAPVIATMGDVISITAISQVNVLSEGDSLDAQLPDYSATSRAINAAQIALESSADPEDSGDEPDVNLPKFWQVERLEGDLIAVNTFQQHNFASDDDIAQVSISASNTFMSTGENRLVNLNSTVELGFHYDLIVVGGSMIDISLVTQVNVLLDRDDVTHSGPGVGVVSGADNMLLNVADLKTVGIDSYRDMPANFAAAGEALQNGGRSIGADVAQDALFQGSNVLRVLYVDGDFASVDMIEQVNVVGDSDQIHLALDDFMSQNGAVVNLISGSNALMNNASVTEYGMDSTVLARGEVYSDELIHQANLIDVDAMPDGVAMSGLVSEAVAFLADGMIDAMPEDVPGLNLGAIDTGGSLDVMQTALA